MSTHSNEDRENPVEEVATEHGPLDRKELDVRLFELDTQVNETRAQEKHVATLIRIVDLDEEERSLEKYIAKLKKEPSSYVELSKDDIQEMRVERATLNRKLKQLEEHRNVLMTEKREKEAIIYAQAENFIAELIAATKANTEGNDFVEVTVEQRLAALEEVAKAIQEGQTMQYPMHPLRYKSSHFYYLLGEEDPDADNSGRVAVVIRHCDHPHEHLIYIIIAKVDIKDGIVTIGEEDGVAVCELDGTVYHGKFNTRAARTGTGVASYTDGTRYEGTWYKNLRSEHGTMTFPDGSVYTGAFDRDTMHGEGVMTFANGDSYEGAFFRNRREGHAVIHYSTGEQYEGAFAENVRQGIGKCIYTDGLTYEGEWHNDMRMGHGVLSNEVGGCYDGPWKCDTKHGEGAVHFGEGTRYDGKWKAGIRRGQASNFTVSADKAITDRPADTAQ